MTLALRLAPLVLLLVLLDACAANELTPAGAKITIDRAPRAGCRLVAAARGAAGYNGRSGEENAAAALRYLRNQAAERGGDSLVITARQIGGGEDQGTLSTPRGATSGGCPNCVSMTASVYACGAAPQGRAPPVSAEAPPFQEKAAEAALAAAASSASRCAASGEARVSVTFAATGDVVYVEVDGEAFAGTTAGECVARKFRNARVPAFTGEARSFVRSVPSAR